jgi:hypothetical protein
MKRNKKSTSEAVRQQADKARKHTVLTVSGIGVGKLVHIEPRDFKRLDVDPSYQRGETKMVSTLVTVLQRGGKILDPVTVCERSWDRHGKLWIIDGHQRVCAFQQLGMGFTAMLHSSSSLEAERSFFIASNARKAVSPNLMVKSWAGGSGKMVVAANETPSHPLYNRLGLEQGGSMSRIGSMIAARGCYIAATGHKPFGSAADLLSRLDVACGVPGKKAKAEAYLRVLGQLVPKGRVNVNVAEALAQCCHEKWEEGISYPSQRSVTKLASLNWQIEVPILVRKYVPVIQGIINRWWK